MDEFKYLIVDEKDEIVAAFKDPDDREDFFDAYDDMFGDMGLKKKTADE